MSPDEDKFPCLRLAKEALSAGGIMPLWLNAANEVLVDAFLEGKIGFSSIASLLETSLAKCPSVSVKNLKNKSPADKRANDSTDFPINLKTNLRKNKFGTKSLETNQAERKNPEINQARAESPETIQARAESLEANQAERRGLETNQVRARNSEINLATEPILTLEEVNAFDEESRHITKALIEASQNK